MQLAISPAKSACFLPNGSLVYHTDVIGEENQAEIQANPDTTFTWNTTLEPFTSLMVRVPPGCNILMSHSGTTNGPIRLGACENCNEVYSMDFANTIKDLSFTADSEICLQKLYVQVKRG